MDLHPQIASINHCSSLSQLNRKGGEETTILFCPQHFLLEKWERQSWTVVKSGEVVFLLHQNWSRWALKPKQSKAELLKRAQTLPSKHYGFSLKSLSHVHTHITLVASECVGVMYELPPWCFSGTVCEDNLMRSEIVNYTYHFQLGASVNCCRHINGQTPCHGGLIWLLISSPEESGRSCY